MLFFAGTTFLSAFLLFCVQPLIAKQILPWFGGSSSVWSMCMLFFQAELLLGYAYVHFLHEKFAARRQVALHSALLLLSLATLPITANPAWKDLALTNPSLGVCVVLGLSVGVPYLMLSTTGPLMQAWYAKAFSVQGAAAPPYRLYALSNLASMASLLSYPIVVEPVLTLDVQANVWSALYMGFVVLCLLTAGLVWRRTALDKIVRSQDAQPASGSVSTRPGWRQCLLWTGLAATASILLLSLTRQLTTDVAPVPFLWVLPLSIYLLSFILCFDAPRYYVRPLFLAALPLSLLAIHYAIDYVDSVPIQIALINGALFVFCMVCHGELTRRKPAVNHLTLFYLMLSIGGALGGTLVGLLAPAVFNSYYELPLGLFLCATLAIIAFWKDSRPAWRTVMLFALAFYVWRLGLISLQYSDGYRVVTRNFYGQTRVEDRIDPSHGVKRVMVHGTIVHGEQLLDPTMRRTPTAYYCEQSGIGRAIESLSNDTAHRIGIVGLGAGTLAVYGRSGDELRLYEINEQVLDAAHSQFTYLSDTPAMTTAVLGDARLMLERESSQQFDLLAIDAFSGDSIPVHLITLEATQIYLQHLKSEGILAVHITNHYLDLQPVMAAAAEHFDRVALVFDLTPTDQTPFCRHSIWALLVPREMLSHLPSPLEDGKQLQASPRFRPWTDSFSNLLDVLQ